MASEITYAEVKFKNELPAPVVKGLPKKKKPEQHPQKYPLWLPWLISLLLLLVCIALVVVLLERGWTCCPKGWRRFQGSCYFLSPDTMSWSESAQNCTGMGSQLVVINSKAEQEFLSVQIGQLMRRDNFYIGLFLEKVGQWQWVDKTPYNGTPMFWREGEPSPGHENCTVMHAPEKALYNWNNVKPDTMHHRICEVAAVIV
ncbi:C-type lectin domain family 4 member A-like isoform X2 [Vidua chalybeata]|uniref:C-type lectin domain family 4 member A-like isoform X2 n=1 Tax=Vidua chalybeata TaxID=81927 RepID=UPI0023A8B0A4|nr:C-type lectin domain family 4 member A-like isoform X2 [Vidua chalybeata]